MSLSDTEYSKVRERLKRREARNDLIACVGAVTTAAGFCALVVLIVR